MPCAIHPHVLTNLNACSRCGGTFCGDCLITLQGLTVCARCKGGVVQDIRSGVALDGVELAGRGARFVAAVVDGMILGIPLFVVLFALGLVSFDPAVQAKTPLWTTVVQLVVQVGASVLYEGLQLSRMDGQTIGKKLAKIRVVGMDGEALTANQCWGRGLSRALMAATQILGLVDVLFIFGGSRRTLHDQLAKTRVVTA